VHATLILYFVHKSLVQGIWDILSIIANDATIRSAFSKGIWKVITKHVDCILHDVSRVQGSFSDHRDRGI